MSNALPCFEFSYVATAIAAREAAGDLSSAFNVSGVEPSSALLFLHLQNTEGIDGRIKLWAASDLLSSFVQLITIIDGALAQSVPWAAKF